MLLFFRSNLCRCLSWFMCIVVRKLSIIYKIPWELPLDLEVHRYINLWAQFANWSLQGIPHTSIQQKIYLYLQVLLFHFMVLSFVMGIGRKITLLLAEELPKCTWKIFIGVTWWPIGRFCIFCTWYTAGNFESWVCFKWKLGWTSAPWWTAWYGPPWSKAFL